MSTADFDFGAEFERLNALDNDARATALAQLAASHPAQARELAGLLVVDAAALARVDAVFFQAHADAANAAFDDRLGRRIGPWQVGAEIGAGGMGSVHRAERVDGAYTATVAIKFLRGFPHREALLRFARERQALARLKHPHIAALIDGGSTDDGQPYLVMALIDGVAIDQWCAARSASVELRLKLVEQVCLGVENAHQQLIVHRDLKPSNVLVDRNGCAYVTDFGIAKLLDLPTGEPTRAAFTPAYASPEQRAGAPVSTLSDIYSLGRLLAELLGAALSDRELAAIVACATHEQPSRRYRSALALSDDLRRYREKRPLHAHRDTYGYRLLKLLKRHPLGAAVGLAALLIVFAFAIGLKTERDRAQLAERVAQERAALAEQTTRFLVELFRGADPAQAQAEAPSARALLDRGYANLSTAPIASAAVSAELYGTLGEIYQTIGEPERALHGIERALTLVPPDALATRARLLERRSLLKLGQTELKAALTDADAALALYEQAGLGAREAAAWAQITRSKPYRAGQRARHRRATRRAVASGRSAHVSRCARHAPTALRERRAPSRSGARVEAASAWGRASGNARCAAGACQRTAAARQTRRFRNRHRRATGRPPTRAWRALIAVWTGTADPRGVFGSRRPAA
jgi:eukaryotic-like serine/threonine-protein kinase